jgi:membrane associated rhomboid family serine protease
MNYRPSFLGSIPVVVKNLIIINVLVLLATYSLRQAGIDLYDYLGLYFPLSEKFRLHQFFTYMFMHSLDPTHLFFNMFALYMFGRVLESVWGPKRFLMFYLVTGVGAALIQTLVTTVEYQYLISKISPDQVEYYKELAIQGKFIPGTVSEKMAMLFNTPTVGASGAVFGILLGFGMLFPNTQLMLLFPPIPIKAKYFVAGYGLLELFFGVSGIQGSVAHFAHLGGMLFGYFMIRYWNKTLNRFY